MSSTYGRKILPVPPGLETGLRDLGFRPVQATLDGTHRWTHPKLRNLTHTLITSTIPGDDAVVVKFDLIPGAPRRLEPEQLLMLLKTMMGGR